VDSKQLTPNNELSDSDPESCKSGSGPCNKCSEGSDCKKCKVVSLETHKQIIEALTFVFNDFIAKARDVALRLPRSKDSTEIFPKFEL
jgi:hypothetical protein